MTVSLVLSAPHRDQICSHARTAYPDECCGLLVGRGSADTGFRVERVIPAANVHPDPARHFEVDPTIHIQWQRRLRGTASRIIGHYHSHPDGVPEPSMWDRGAVIDSGLVWLIVAVGRANATMLAWLPGADGGGFQTVRLDMLA
ncbi:MAG: M67 family metallopeptidase [Sphingomonadales bacterium]